MKYKTHIFPEGEGYVGQAIVEGKVVYTTNVVKDSIMVARELSNYIANAGNTSPTNNIKTSPLLRRQVASPTSYNEVPSSEPVKSTGPFFQASSNQELPTEHPINNPPRRCCGRG